MNKITKGILIVTLVGAFAATALVGCTKKIENPNETLKAQIEASMDASTYYAKKSVVKSASDREDHTLNVHTENGTLIAHKQVEMHGILQTTYKNSYYGIPKGQNQAVYIDNDGKKTAISEEAFFALDEIAPYTLESLFAGLKDLNKEAYTVVKATVMGRVHEYELKFDQGVKNPYSDRETLLIEAANGKISKITDDADSPSFTIYVTYYGPNITLPR